MSEWRDIESAPKDGSSVDIWLSSPDRVEQWRETDCWWNADRKLWCNVNGCWGSATHWMPLPDPPAANTQAPVRKLDRQRLKEVVEETSKWPAYMRGEVGSKAPSRIDPPAMMPAGKGPRS